MKIKNKRVRLDELVMSRGFCDSLEKARAMIIAGEVFVDGQRADKAGTAVSSDSDVAIASRSQKFASRGGFKLEGALDDFHIEVAGKVCLDVGASTGGFTDCLLQRGAARVYAVDVTSEQMAWRLQQDCRVIRIERNARRLVREDVPEEMDVVTVDVSFISAGKVLAPAVAVARPDADFLILVKPQFELRREEIGSGGIVNGPGLHEKAISIVKEAAAGCGLCCCGVKPSHLPGAEGNQEFFLHARRKPLE